MVHYDIFLPACLPVFSLSNYSSGISCYDLKHTSDYSNLQLRKFCGSTQVAEIKTSSLVLFLSLPTLYLEYA